MILMFTCLLMYWTNNLRLLNPVLVKFLILLLGIPVAGIRGNGFTNGVWFSFLRRMEKTDFSLQIIASLGTWVHSARLSLVNCTKRVVSVQRRRVEPFSTGERRLRSEDDGIEKSPDDTSTEDLVGRLITTHTTARDNGSSTAERGDLSNGWVRCPGQKSVSHLLQSIINGHSLETEKGWYRTRIDRWF